MANSRQLQQLKEVARDVARGLEERVITPLSEVVELQRARIQELESELARSRDFSRWLFEAAVEAVARRSLKPLEAWLNPPRKAGRPALDLATASATVGLLEPYVTRHGSINKGVTAMLRELGVRPTGRRRDNQVVDQFAEHYRSCKRRVARG